MDKSGTSHIARALRGDGSPGHSPLARGFRLGAWCVRPDLCAIEKNGRSVQLEPKTMGVLLCLAQHAPNSVTREQLIEEVWNGRVVTDEVLSRAISLLRSELEDDAHEPRFVRTIPRVGYALIATVGKLDLSAPGATETDTRAGAAGPSPAIARRRAPRPWTLALGLAALAAALGISWWLSTRSAPDPAGPVRLAVLPLATVGAAVDDAYLADGLTEELTVSLSRLKGVRVVARNSALRFRSGDADLVEVARVLRATHVVTGSVRATGSRLRVNVHLADSASGTELWAESYDREFGDLFGVQAEIAAAIAQALRQRLAAALPAAADSASLIAAEGPPSNPEAYKLYLQGRQQLARRGEEGIRAAIALLEDAVSADPGFIRAQAALAWACTLLVNVAPAEASVALARADLALAAVARQTAMSDEVHAVRAWLELERNHWIEAEEAFSAALAANPDDTELRLLYSQMLGAGGKREAAWREARLALANDPLSPAANLRLAVLSVWANQDREAERYLKTARDLGLAPSASPEVPMLLLVRQRRMGPLQEVLREVQRRRGQADDWIPVAVAAIHDPGRADDAGTAMEHAAAAGQIDRLLHLGALVLVRQNERALQLLLSQPRLRTREMEFVFSREATELRRMTSFGQVVTQFGLDAYWDRFGWPPECARVTGSISCH
jgi:TolB-like protein/DNA-binding winged helix-turn-helix (wHTH) protein/Tfp pilus assembly protein PilF